MPAWRPNSPLGARAYTASGQLIAIGPATVTAQGVTFGYRQRIEGHSVAYYKVGELYGVFLPLALRQDEGPIPLVPEEILPPEPTGPSQLEHRLEAHHGVRGRGVGRVHAQHGRLGVLDLGPGAGALHALRWELLHDPEEPGRLLAMDENTLFSRYLPSRDKRPVPRRSAAGMKALVVVAKAPAAE